MKSQHYQTYKNSETEWLEQIPEHWQEKRIKDLSFLQSGINITSDQIEEEDKYPVYGGNGLRGYFSKYTNEGEYVLIGRQGALCGNINYASGKFWATEHAVVVYLKPNIDWKWYGEMLRVMNLNQYSVSAAQPGLSVDRIKRLLLPVPSFLEQQAIATYLDTKTAQIDRKIDLLTQKAQRYEELKRSLINETVTRGLDKSVPMKDSAIEWIGEIPEHWEIHRIKDFTYVKGRIGWQGLRSSDFLDTGDYYCVTGTDLIDGLINWSDCYFVSKARYEQDKYIQLKVGDLLITKDRTIGKTALVDASPKDSTLNSGLFVTRPLKDKYLNIFLYWVLNSSVFRNYIDLTKGGSTIQHLYQNVFDRFLYCCPPLTEQKEISDYLSRKSSHIDQIIQSINMQIESQKELRKTLINDVVTGKIKVADS
jgi:type I restriction enzyme S subunit